MANIETAPRAGPTPIWLDKLTPADVQGLNQLVEESRWNQIEDDWRLFMAFGHIAVIRDAAGRIIASGAVLPFEHETAAEEQAAVRGPRATGMPAWISMILVHPTQRGEGLGSLIFRHCLALALSQGHIPMLDATPQGAPLYQRHGLEPLWSLSRWERAGPAPAQGSSCPPACTPQQSRPQPQDHQALEQFDRSTLGLSRAHILRHLLARPGSGCIVQPDGYALVRRGRLAMHIGPIVSLAPTQDAGLVAQAIDMPFRLFIDVPDSQSALQQQLQAAGFVRQRGFTRMAGPAPIPWPKAALPTVLAIAGPEYG